jgi:hypothetical protein
MAAWSDVGLAVVAGAIGVGGTLAATRAQMRDSRSQRRAAEQAARVNRVASVLGPIQTLLIDLMPPRALSNFSEVAHVSESRRERWLPLRDQLEVVLVMEPDADIRDSMRRLEVSIENTYTRLGLALNPNAAMVREDGRTFYDDAVDHHTEAARIAEEIAADLHLEGNGRATRRAENDRDFPPETFTDTEQ